MKDRVLRAGAATAFAILLIGDERPAFADITIWTNAAFELASAQADVQSWPVPSLTLIR